MLAVDLRHLKAPDLWPPVGLSRSEHDATKLLNSSVLALPYFVESFDAALELYRFSLSKPPNVSSKLTSKWRWIGVHEGAMQIWFLREAMDLTTKWFRACPAVKTHFDESAKQRSFDLFDKHFPDGEEIRHATAHAPSESHKSLRKWLSGEIKMGPRLKEGDVYELEINGVTCTVEMRDETAAKLIEVLKAFWTAFAPVEKAFELAGRSDG